MRWALSRAEEMMHCRPLWLTLWIVAATLFPGLARAQVVIKPQTHFDREDEAATRRRAALANVAAATTTARAKLTAAKEAFAKKERELAESRPARVAAQRKTPSLVSQGTPEQVVDAADKKVLEPLHKSAEAAHAEVMRAIPDSSRRELHDLAVEDTAVTATALTGIAPQAPGFTTVALAGTSWETSVVSGLAQFMADRANQELSLWLTSEVANKLCGADGLRDLLPHTCALVKPDPKEDVADMATLGGLLAAAIRSDLEALPLSVLARFVKLSATSTQALQSVLDQLRSGVAPLPLLAGFATDSHLHDACMPANAATEPPSAPAVPDASACWLVAVGELVKGMGTVLDAPTPEEATRKITELVDRGTLLLTALSACATTPTCATYVNKVKADENQLKVLKAELTALFTDAKELYATVEGWKKAPAQDTGTTLARAAEVILRVKAVLDDGFPILREPFPAIASLETDWSAASPLILATADGLKGQYGDCVSEVLKFANAHKTVRFPPPLIKYLGFAVDLARAENATDVKALIDTATVPVGGWRLKRQHRFVASITSLVGLAIGGERSLDLHNPTGTVEYAGTLGSVGLVGALGLDLSWNRFFWETSTGGFYISVLDVGQLINLPFGSPATSTSKATAGGEISLAQVFSPGVYARWGLWDSPFVLGVGAVYAPSARKYEYTTSAGSDQVSVIRIQGFLAIDVTMFPL